MLLSVVALMAAWSGYSAAKWGTESSLSLAKASATRTKANLAAIEATQIRTLDSVSFNTAFDGLHPHDPKLFALAVSASARATSRPSTPGWRPTR